MMILLKNQTISLSTKLLFPMKRNQYYNHIHNFSSIHPSIHRCPMIRDTQLQEFEVYQLILIQITILFAKGSKETASHRVSHSISSPSDTRYFVAQAVTTLCFTSPLHLFFLLPFLLFSSFFFPPPSIDYRYPIEDSTKLSGGVRASACSFALAVSRGLVLALMSDDKGFQR